MAVLGLPPGAISAVATGSHYSCALHSNRQLYCWGGIPALGDFNTAQPVPGMSDVVRFRAGASICAIDSQQRLFCWGYNNHGQVGDNTTIDRPDPAQVTGLAAALDVCCGEPWDPTTGHTCAVDSQQRVFCWGYNHAGQLGDGTTTERHKPVQVSGISARQVSCGKYSTCAVDLTGKVVCWGENSDGQLGFFGANQKQPVPVTGIATAAAVFAGDNAACMIATSGSTFCWGGNYLGKLTQPTSMLAILPTLITSLPAQVRSLAVSENHGCAVLADHRVLCWGAGEYIGQPAAQDSLTPLQVTGVP